MLNDKNLILPDYTGCSLADIPQAILTHFNIKSNQNKFPEEWLKNIKSCSKLVLFTIDGFGYNLWNEAVKYSFFKKINDKKRILPITTVFPSTTAAAITTLSSGLTPIEHGLLEWNLYFQELDLILQPLPYEMVETEYHRLNKDIPNYPEMLFTSTTLAQKLKKGGISSIALIPQILINTPYTHALSRDAKIVPYFSIADLIVLLRNALQAAKGETYFYVYIPIIDSAEHYFGQSSEQVKTEMSLLAYLLEKEFIHKITEEIKEDTALMLTADHGQLDVNPHEMIYLNQYPELLKYFERSKANKPILPTGSPRDVFLHIQDDKIDKAIALLKAKLSERAEVVRITDEIILKLFGNKVPHPQFYNRLGNVLILPKENNTVWYKYLPDQKDKFRGFHGGLTRDEMMIPFVCSRISELV